MVVGRVRRPRTRPARRHPSISRTTRPSSTQPTRLSKVHFPNRRSRNMTKSSLFFSDGRMTILASSKNSRGCRKCSRGLITSAPKAGLFQVRDPRLACPNAYTTSGMQMPRQAIYLSCTMAVTPTRLLTPNAPGEGEIPSILHLLRLIEPA